MSFDGSPVATVAGNIMHTRIRRVSIYGTNGATASRGHPSVTFPKSYDLTAMLTKPANTEPRTPKPWTRKPINWAKAQNGLKAKT